MARRWRRGVRHLTAFDRRVLSLSVVLFAGCGILDPSPSLVIEGRVEAADGAPVAGAAVNVLFTDFMRDRGPERIGGTQSGPEGEFTLEVGAPEGYSYPNCATLSLVAYHGGFQASASLASNECGPGSPARIGGIVLTMPPSDPADPTP